MYSVVVLECGCLVWLAEIGTLAELHGFTALSLLFLGGVDRFAASRMRFLASAALVHPEQLCGLITLLL